MLVNTVKHIIIVCMSLEYFKKRFSSKQDIQAESSGVKKKNDI